MISFIMTTVVAEDKVFAVLLTEAVGEVGVWEDVFIIVVVIASVVVSL